MEDAHAAIALAGRDGDDCPEVVSGDRSVAHRRRSFVDRTVGGAVATFKGGGIVGS